MNIHLRKFRSLKQEVVKELWRYHDLLLNAMKKFIAGSWKKVIGCMNQSSRKATFWGAKL